MNKYILLFSFFMAMLLPLHATVSIIPQPQKCVEKRGHFTVNDQTIIVLPSEDPDMLNAVSVWNELLTTAAGFKLQTTTAASRKSNIIACSLNNKLANDEAYKLKITKGAIHIEAKTAKGIFYAFQSLRQLMPSSIESPQQVQNVAWQVPCAVIEDAPAFGYRGMMLDVARHFKSKEFVKRYIDLMAFHKLNTLHWHLTDDQGWRIEIKKYPKLTTVGGFRNQTLIGHGGKRPFKWNIERYGGFYTQEDIKEVLEYANKRFVEVIPEIEMPGHSVAALTAYPQFSCSGGPFEVEGRWGVFNDIFCSKEPTFTFLQEILDEVVALFPSQYIHIGGDEAPKVRWKRCAACQERIAQNNLPDEAHLQSYFINRIEKYLNGKGKKIIGWDEILEGDISKTATIMSWRGEKGGIQAAKNGHDVLMTPNSHCYFDKYHHDPKAEPLAIGGLLSVEKVYSYHPIPKELTAEQAERVKGVQANMWSEYMPSDSHTESMAYPRAAALAEVAWTLQENKDFTSFASRLQNILSHYDVMGVNYFKPVFPATNNMAETKK